VIGGIGLVQGIQISVGSDRFQTIQVGSSPHVFQGGGQVKSEESFAISDCLRHPLMLRVLLVTLSSNCLWHLPRRRPDVYHAAELPLHWSSNPSGHERIVLLGEIRETMISNGIKFRPKKK
jgi:hypothetical protein